MLPQFLPGGRKIVIKRKLIAMERLASITNMTIHRKAMVVQQELVMVPMERQNMAITIVAMIIKISIARIFVQGFQKMLRLLPGFKVPQAQISLVKTSHSTSYICHKCTIHNFLLIRKNNLSTKDS